MSMAFARPKPDANDEWIRHRNTELSDVIRARNKREDRLLNVRLKFYERERNIRLSMIRQEQYQLERVRTALVKDANRIQTRKQNLSLPLWMSPRPKSQGQILQLSTPKLIVADRKLNSTLIQPERVSTDNTLATSDVLRRHSAR